MTRFWNLLVPRRACQWGALTREGWSWHDDRLSHLANFMRRRYGGPFAEDLQALLNALSDSLPGPTEGQQ